MADRRLTVLDVRDLATAKRWATEHRQEMWREEAHCVWLVVMGVSADDGAEFSDFLRELAPNYVGPPGL